MTVSSLPAPTPRHHGGPNGTRLTKDERRARTDALLAQIADCRDEPSRQLLREEVVRLNLDVAEAVVSRYRNRGLDGDDLRQVAFLGLVKAVRGFDPDAGFAFLSYAVPTIRGEVLRHFRDAGWAVRPPRPIQELQPRIASAREELCHQLGRAPRPSEIAEHLGVAVDEVADAMAADGCFSPNSLDSLVVEGESGTLSDRLACDDSSDLAAVDARVILAPALRHLAPRDRRIVYLRFFEGLTQREIGEQLGVTQMQVSRLLNRILRNLRDSLDSPGRPAEPAAAQPGVASRAS